MLLFWIRHECAGLEHSDQRRYGGSAAQSGWSLDGWFWSPRPEGVSGAKNQPQRIRVIHSGSRARPRRSPKAY